MSTLSPAARRLLERLPAQSPRTLRRLAYEAGVSEVPTALSAAKELLRSGVVMQARENGGPVHGGTLLVRSARDQESA